MERGGDGYVQCKLHTYPIDEAPSFIALSYTWGLPSIVRKILLDDEEFAIRANLHAALLMLLQKKEQEYQFPSWFPWVPLSTTNSTLQSSVEKSVPNLGPFAGAELDMMDRNSETTAWNFF